MNKTHIFFFFIYFSFFIKNTIAQENISLEKQVSVLETKIALPAVELIGSNSETKNYQHTSMLCDPSVCNNVFITITSISFPSFDDGFFSSENEWVITLGGTSYYFDVDEDGGTYSPGSVYNSDYCGNPGIPITINLGTTNAGQTSTDIDISIHEDDSVSFNCSNDGTDDDFGSGTPAVSLVGNSFSYSNSGETFTFNYTVNCTTVGPNNPPSSGGDQTICVGETATISASSPGFNVNWYNAPSGGSLLASNSNTFTTPALTSNTIYYAEAQDASGCASTSRTAVTVLVEFCCPIISSIDESNPTESNCATGFGLQPDASGLAYMGATQNGETDFGIQFVVFSGATAPSNPYLGGTNITSVPYSALTGASPNQAADGDSNSPNDFGLNGGTYQLCAILSPAPTTSTCATAPAQCRTIEIEDEPIFTFGTVTAADCDDNDGGLEVTINNYNPTTNYTLDVVGSAFADMIAANGGSSAFANANTNIYPGISFAAGVITFTGLNSGNVTLTVSSTNPFCNSATASLLPFPSILLECDPVVCSIDALSIGTQTACDPATESYAQDVIITYTDPPLTGDLLVNGMTYPITTSPQTVRLMNLPANGTAVNVAVSFSADATCSLNQSNAFVAPMNCASCTDGFMNGNETGVDCGGSDCPACPTCSDDIMNGNETGVDCGGPDCPACPTCSDGIMNGDETNIDCGGSTCPVCPTCTDGIQNGDETGLDCGGLNCPVCPVCTVSQYYTGAVLSGVYQTSNVIGSSALVPSTENVSFYAGCINLDEGFEVAHGAEFLAEPTPCAPLTTNETAALAATGNTFVVIQNQQFTNVSYILENNSNVKLILKNMDVSVLETLIPTNTKLAGEHLVQIDTTPLKKGVYFLLLKTNKGEKVERIVIQ